MRLLLVMIGLVAGAAACISLLPLNVWFGALQSWLSQMGPLAFVVFGLFYALATATVLPGAPLSIAAGLLFGAAGFPLAMLSAATGATAGYCISRFFFRERVVKLMAERPLLKALDHAIAEQGWRVVCLVRMSPLVPFNMQNHLFGVTQIRIGPYVLATLAGIFANTALCVYVGTLGRTSLAAVGPAALVLPGIGIVCSLLAVILVSGAARRRLLRIVAENTP